jgi:hypothetical protein
MKRALVLGGALALATIHSGSRAGLTPALAEIDEAITTMDFERAHALTDGVESGDPRFAVEKARLALYELRCDEAAAALGRTELAHSEAASYLGDIARGCARVTAATMTERDEAAGVEVTWQDENDRALRPILIDTVVKAREALTRDLGVTWTRPMRIVVVRDLHSLSAMTGLEYKDASTTGTVAIAKWGRVTILSPRASHHGFAWRDTMAHELTHLAVTRITSDRAPLWLQEGVAKREEVRWRAPGPFDYRPSPESVVSKGIELKMDLPLDKLGRSIAMLPSADKAAVAFAEVTSFIRYYAENAGPDALPRLLLAVKAKDDANAALQEVSGTDFAGWDTKWRAWLAEQPKEPLPSTWGLGGAPPGLRDLRERARLTELLLGRDHAKDALKEIDPIPATSWTDASLRHLRGRVMEAAGEGEPAVTEKLGEPKDVASGFGPWWAIRARMARVRGGADAAVAEGYFVEAVAQDPFDVESACQSLDPAASTKDPQLAPLCDAARAMGAPDIGKD